MKSGCPLTVSIEPQPREGTKRVLELRLDISVKPGTAGRKLDELEFHIKNSEGAELNESASLSAALKTFDSINGRNQDPFVTIRLDNAVTVEAAAQVCDILSKIDTEKGIRIEPPSSGQLYYRAFVPNEKQRNRADRFAQPWELSLSVTNSNIHGILSKIDQIWKTNKTEPDLKATDFTADTPQDFLKTLKEKGPGVPVIFVFADPAVSHGQLMSFIGPVQETHPMIHVYLKPGQ